MEEHLTIPRMRCPDCIRKHNLWAEALADEALLLDKNQEHTALLEDLPERIRGFQRDYHRGVAPKKVAQDVRELRKELVKVAFHVGL